ncbi:MAG: hypothetical protein ABEJ83_05325, partial [Candidatus Nanohaloarchaea archaeon]
MSGSDDNDEVSFDEDILSSSSEEEEVVFPGSSEEEEIPGEGSGPSIDVDFPDPERFAEPVARRVVQAVAPMYEDLGEDHDEIRDSIDSLEDEIDDLGGRLEVNIRQLEQDHEDILDLAYEINNQLDDQLEEDDIRQIVREETPDGYEIESPGSKDSWGYGFLNLGYDLVSFGKHKLSRSSDHRYEDDHGNPKALPQDEDLSRRAVLGMGKEAGIMALLGAGYTLSQQDQDKSQVPQEEEKLSMGERYDLSEVEKC